jgi:succinate-semialdehyde dehydrogenase / glutarate-semialdehyde dehydrogenase
MTMISSLDSRAFIGGRWVETSERFPVHSPFSGHVVGEVADCGPSEANWAADTAVEAFAGWAATPALERAGLLRAWFDRILHEQDVLARLIALEMGKPIAEARGEVRYAAGFVEWYAEEVKRAAGDIVSSGSSEKKLFAFNVPIGPVVAITPWNFPAAMVTRKAAPALAAGCTVIVKPAPQAPLTALRLAFLWEAVGGPPGTFQVLPTRDPAPLSAVWMADPRIRKLSFTGSTAVGRILYQQAAGSLKHVSLELGGHAPFLIFEDADLDDSVEQVMLSKFRNAGQTCVCTNRIFVHHSLLESFSARLSEAASQLKVGDPLDECTQVGPLVDESAALKSERHVEDARSRGAKILIGGKRGEGTFYLPPVLASVQRDSLILQEETFGPVAPIVGFSNDLEAIELANHTPYGLAAYLWTRDLGRAWRAAEKLEYGIIGVNDGLPSSPHAPFGGVKDSGLGREGGRWGLEEYLETKYLSLKLPPLRNPGSLV